MNTNKKLYSPEQLSTLEKVSVQYIDELYEYFDCDYYDHGNYISSNCFIHDGDNSSALNLYHNGDYRIHYKCRTYNCHEHFGNSLIHMVRAAISRRKYNWKKQGDKEASFKEAVSFLTKLTNQSLEDFSEDHPIFERKKFKGMIDKINPNESSEQIICSIDQYKKSITIPSPYYLKREPVFDISTLNKFSVGVCTDIKKQMYNRSVVPILDYSGNNVVGVSGRSLFEECEHCNQYHDPNLDCTVKPVWFPKWRHSKGLQRENHVYNFANALEYIKKEKFVIVVESPANVWRLHEIGIYNVVALLGTAFNDKQKALLDTTGALSIVVIMDNDDAGLEAAIKIRQKCQRLYNVYTPDFLIEDDIADTENEKLKEILLPILEDIRRQHQ